MRHCNSEQDHLPYSTHNKSQNKHLDVGSIDTFSNVKSDCEKYILKGNCHALLFSNIRASTASYAC